MPTDSVLPDTAPASTARRLRGRWLIALGVLAIVVVGAWVGTTAGRLAHRAPRASGTRVAVLPFDEGALARDFAAPAAPAEGAGSSTHHIVPLPVVRAKLALMERGGRPGTLADAAGILDVDRVVTGAVMPQGEALALRLEVAPPGRPPTGVLDVALPGEAPLQEALAGVPALLTALGRPGAAAHGPAPPAPPTDDVAAYGAFVQGRALFDEGRLRDAVALFAAASDSDPRFAEPIAQRAIALSLLRDRDPTEEAQLSASLDDALAARAALAPISDLLIDGLGARRRFLSADGDSAAARAAVGEEVFAAFRAVTVRFPEERLGHLFLGRAYVEILGGPQEALRHLESARRLSPDWFPTVAELVDTWLKMGDRKHAAGEIRGYLVVKKDDEAARALLQAIGE
jgi:hypothetical protein